MASLGTLSVDIGAKTQQFTSALTQAAARAADFAKNAGASFNRVSTEAKGMAGGIGQMFAAIQISNMVDRAANSILGLAKNVISLSADAEVMTQKFEVLTGNVGKGAAMFRELERFAARTSFSVQSAGDAATLLLAKGVQQNDLVPTMQLLGDLALGNEEKLGFLAKAYSDVQAKGRLMAQEQNQFAENGINLFEILGASTGKNAAELLAMREAGEITFDMLQAGLIQATAKGGKFFQAMEKGNKTFWGQLTTVQENIASIGRMLGDMVLPQMTSILMEANKLLDAFNAMPNRAEFAGKVLEAAMDLAIAYIRNKWDELLIHMIKKTAAAGEYVTLLLNPVTAVRAAAGLGGFLADLFGREGAQNVERAQKKLMDLVAQLQNGPVNAPAPALQPKPPELPPPPKPDVAKAFGNFFDSIAPIGEMIAGDARKLVSDATLQGSLAINQIGRLFGFGTNAQATEVQAAQKTEFAAAAMRGSSEAYGVILSAMKGNSDPVVKETKVQTKELKGALLDIYKVIADGPQVQLLGSFLE